MVGVCAACAAKVVFGGICPPLIQGQRRCTFHNSNTIQGRSYGNRPPTATKRTIAPSRRVQPIAQIHRQFDGPAMTGQTMAQLRFTTLGMRVLVSTYLASGWGGWP